MQMERCLGRPVREQLGMAEHSHYKLLPSRGHTCKAPAVDLDMNQTLQVMLFQTPRVCAPWLRSRFQL